MIEQILLNKTPNEIEKLKAFYLLKKYHSQGEENKIWDNFCSLDNVSAGYYIELNEANVDSIESFFKDFTLSDFLILETPWLCSDPFELERKLSLHAENSLEMLLDVLNLLISEPNDISYRIKKLCSKYDYLSEAELEEIEHLIIYFEVKTLAPNTASDSKYLATWLEFKKLYSQLLCAEGIDPYVNLEQAELVSRKRRVTLGDFENLFISEINYQTVEEAILALQHASTIDLVKATNSKYYDAHLIRDIICKYIKNIVSFYTSRDQNASFKLLIVGADPFIIEHILNIPILKSVEKLFVVSLNEHCCNLLCSYALSTGNKKTRFVQKKMWGSEHRINYYNLAIVLGNSPDFSDTSSIFTHISQYYVRDELPYLALVNANQTANNKYSIFTVPFLNQSVMTAATLPQDIIGKQFLKRKLLIQGCLNSDRAYDKEIELINFRNIKLSGARSQLLTRFNVIKQGNSTHGCKPFLPKPIVVENEYCDFDKTLRETFQIASKTNEQRQPAYEFDFSGDLLISYRIMSNGKTLVANYLAPSDEEDSEKQFGSLMTSTEKRFTLHADTSIEQLLSRKYPLLRLNRSSDQKSVIDEVREIFEPIIINRSAGVNYKTAFWFQYHELSSQLLDSEVNYLLDLFDGPVGFLNMDEKYEVVEEQLKLANQLTSDSVRLLTLLSEVAVKAGYISRTPFKKKESASKDIELQEVRKAIQQKNFPREFLNSLVENLINYTIPEKPEYVGLLIRLLTGLNAAIVCELRWRDLKKVEDYGFFQFNIERQQLSDGTVEYFRSQSDYRLIPACRILEKVLLMLQERSQPDEDDFIVATIDKKGLSAKKLSQLPIPNLKKTSNKILIPKDEDWIEIDLAQYHGDFFRANADFWFGYECKLTNDEIRYLLGNYPASTVGRHYRDFRNDDTQYLLYCKMNRWQFTPKKSNSGMVEYNLLHLKVPANTETEIYAEAENGVEISAYQMEEQ